MIARLDAIAGPYALHVLAFFGAFTIVVGLLKFSTAFLSLFVLSGASVDRPHSTAHPKPRVPPFKAMGG